MSLIFGLLFGGRVSEDKMADDYLNNPMGYKRIYYAGWRVVEKDNPEAQKVIDELQVNDTAGPEELFS